MVFSLGRIVVVGSRDVVGFAVVYAVGSLMGYLVELLVGTLYGPDTALKVLCGAPTVTTAETLQSIENTSRNCFIQVRTLKPKSNGGTVPRCLSVRRSGVGPDVPTVCYIECSSYVAAW